MNWICWTGRERTFTPSASAAPRAPTSALTATTLAEAVTLEEVQERGETLLLPTDSLFQEYPILLLKSAGAETRVRGGAPITDPGVPDGTYRIYRPGLL